eukprot:TRINITY_DN95966_c0_g1_i1.p1 TRINITY_DN95966_c0_g1~~TRINITY_DN95966_c0_g1_i1.p1  ORF type:complete len:183 (+),score=33.36 TRINITY_DN95966_c0_g1_i1:57-605(+)
MAEESGEPPAAEPPPTEAKPAEAPASPSKPSTPANQHHSSAPNWPGNLHGSLASSGDRLRTHAQVLGQFRTMLGYEFPVAYNQASTWAEGIRRTASAPVLAKGKPSFAGSQMAPDRPAGLQARRRQPVVASSPQGSPSMSMSSSLGFRQARNQLPSPTSPKSPLSPGNRGVRSPVKSASPFG